MLSQIHKNFGGERAACTALLALCLVSGAAGRVSAASVSTAHSPSSTASFNSAFAIADFDGDRKPDLATVEIQGGSSSSTTRYSIRFRLTAGATQSFGVSAPAGGLQIMARDVNGDDALDLLISTAWLHQQVAVLLNDGHGNFTLAKPSAFPTAVWESAADWESGAATFCDSAVLGRSEYSAGEFEAVSQLHGLQQQPGQDPLPICLGKAHLLLFSLLGRAPPAFVLQA